MHTGIRAVFSRSHERLGWDIYLRKNEGNKLYQPSRIDIESEECFEGSMCRERISVNTLDSYDSPDRQSALYGENEALKSEIKFLRDQIALLLRK